MEAKAKEAKTAERAKAAEAEPTHDTPLFSPRTDIYETADEVVVLAEMPGAAQKDISVTFEDDLLTIAGTVGGREPSGMELLRRGYQAGGFRREFRVMVDIDPAKIAAKTSQGVLRVVLPKAEKAKPRKINIEVA